MRKITLIHDGTVITGDISDEDCARLYQKFDKREILTVPESQEIMDCMINKEVKATPKAVALNWKGGEA